MSTTPSPILSAIQRAEGRAAKPLAPWTTGSGWPPAPVNAGDARSERWVAFESVERALQGIPAGDGEAGQEVGEALYVALADDCEDRALATLRNRLWPAYHVTAFYRSQAGQLLRRSLSGEESVAEFKAGADTPSVVLVAHPVNEVMSPTTTQVKFDKNAQSWDGERGSATYGHFRWMRRFVGLYHAPSQAKRILDFGCGAGWVGIEAAKRHPQAHLSFFDPSPEMVRIAEGNASAEGLASFEGRVGFGEAPPFPIQGQAPYDWVISSGVISFSPDPKAWIEGLMGTLAPGGRLIIGDIHGDSWGFRRRRAKRPLLPVREMNAKDPNTVRRTLEEAGLRFLGGSGYQCTYPIPELTHVGGRSVGRLATIPLLWLNRSAAWLSRATGGGGKGAFDSWVMAFDRKA